MELRLISPRRVVLAAVLGAVAAFGCRAERAPPAPASAARASSVPWQPDGLRMPTVRCVIDTPSGWKRSPSPMPDHVAELMADGAPNEAVAIVAERVEPTAAAARERVLQYWQGGEDGARTTEDAPFAGARAPARVLSMRSGKPGAGRVESVVLLAFPGLPLVEIVARYQEGDAAVREAINALARTAWCTRP